MSRQRWLKKTSGSLQILQNLISNLMTVHHNRSGPDCDIVTATGHRLDQVINRGADTEPRNVLLGRH